MTRLRWDMGEVEEILGFVEERSLAFLRQLPDREVGTTATAEALRERLAGPLPEHGEGAREVLERLVEGAEGGLLGSAGPRFFGFVIGGSLPVSLGADWLTSAWDQNAGLFAAAPAASIVEEAVESWSRELLGLPEGASVGLVTGGQMANWTGLAAARHGVLRDAGWDVEAEGLRDAPWVTVVTGAAAHSTIDVALRYLGFGTDHVRRVPADDQGRMRVDALAEVLTSTRGPVIVCAQAGNVNTGAFDPLRQIGELCRERGAWLHVDGAFGLWAAASPRYRHLADGLELASSWATDAHKWLNVPYDCGMVAVADRAAHAGATSVKAPYLIHAEGAARDALDWTPEFSRRARGFTVWAALRWLGRDGVAELVERGCALAVRMADGLRTDPRVTVLNDVVLNQVLVRFGEGEAGDRLTRATVEAIQREGTCWLSGTTWHGRPAMRISVSNWATSEEDADRSVAAILRCLEASR